MHRWWNRHGDLVMAFAILGVIVAVLGALYAGVEMAGCSMRWSGSGYGYRYRPIAGCQVEVARGKWMPERAVRSVE